MKTYCVTIEGLNFWMDMQSKGLVNLGFIKIKYVQAKSEEEAELAAVDEIRKDPKIRANVRNKKDDPPSMQLYAIKEIDNLNQVSDGESGYMFYPMDSKSEEDLG